MKYITDFLCDISLFLGIYLTITLVLSGIIGWTIAIVVVYTDNNWIPLIILSITVVFVGLLCCIITTLKSYIHDRRVNR